MIDDLQEIWVHLIKNKLRTTLTGLSVSVGIFLLILLLGTGNGLINAIKANMGEFPLNLVQLFQGRTSEAYDGMMSNRDIKFTDYDMGLLKKHFPNRIKNTFGELDKLGIFIYGKYQRDANISGVSPDYKDANCMRILYGRYVNLSDMLQNAKVALIDKRSSVNIFGNPSLAIGKEVRVDSVVYKIIGIYANKGNNRQGVLLQIPFSTFRLIYKKGNYSGTININSEGLTTDEKEKSFEQEARSALASYHRFSPNDENAVFFNNKALGGKEFSDSLGYIKTFIWFLGILTLLSGIVGVSNIMLITVKERTHEFGIRKALAARSRTILRSVLLESVIVTAFFGYVGLLLGVIATEYLSYVAGHETQVIADNRIYIFLNPTVDVWVAVRSLLLLIIAGILAGFVPARKAVKILPIEALRSNS